MSAVVGGRVYAEGMDFEAELAELAAEALEWAEATFEAGAELFRDETAVAYALCAPRKPPHVLPDDF